MQVGIIGIFVLLKFDNKLKITRSISVTSIYLVGNYFQFIYIRRTKNKIANNANFVYFEKCPKMPK